MKILFLSRWYPWPTNNGSKLRIYNLLRGLAEHHEVTLLSFADQSDVAADAPGLRSICHEVLVVPWKSFQPRSRRAVAGFVSLAPRSIVDTFSTEMRQRIEEALSSRAYDLIIASQGALAAYGNCFRATPALYEEVELGVFYEQFVNATSPWSRLRFGLTWLKHRRYLDRQLRYFRACTVVSEQEHDLLQQAAPHYAAIEVIPNSLNLADYVVDQAAQPNTLIFTGPFTYRANYNAMRWFLSEVYPRIQAQVPSVHLTITGDHAGLPLPTATNLTLTGSVDDIRPKVAQSWISLAPLREGGGTRLKILEAMALGTPVVATSKGAEGLEVLPDQHLLIADTPEAFAHAVIRLLQEPGLRGRLADNAYALVGEKYSWTATMPRFLNLVEKVAA